MKFYALLCALIALSMLLTPAIALIGADKHEETAVSSGVETTVPEETTEEEMSVTLRTSDG